MTKLMIEPRTPEMQAQRIINSFGYHGCDNVPMEDVVKMLVAYQGFETRRNNTLMAELEDYQNKTLRPIIFQQ